MLDTVEEVHQAPFLCTVSYTHLDVYKRQLWDWKGGAMNGISVASYYNKYPIPVSDINNNRNMSQNEGYK